jgi:alpha-aminoadipic semialdehyde synthase
MINTIAIRREDKNTWEKRTALTPDAVKKLVELGVKVLVQPSKIRVYSDQEYSDAGAEICEDCYSADLVVGVKEMPVSTFRKGGAYMFFSHTMKAQSHNMEMLKKLVENKSTLIDFECITDHNNKRLVFFGKYAGIAGMIDTFHTLGMRLLQEGIKTPFAEVKISYQYDGLKKAKIDLARIAAEISKNNLPEELTPMIFGFTGYGNVSAGAQEIFDIFDFIEITPDQLLKLNKSEIPANKLVKVVFREEDTVEPKASGKLNFDKQHYFDNPSQYKSKFFPFLKHLSCLINCIFWPADAPRLLDLEECDRLFRMPENKLKVIGDVTCDLGGSIECTTEATQPDNPSYVYDIDEKKIRMGYKGNGPTIMAVDNLPCEVPKAASDDFSKALEAFLPTLVKLDTQVDFADLQLSAPIKKAIILWNGEFTPGFAYMKNFIA